MTQWENLELDFIFYNLISVKKKKKDLCLCLNTIIIQKIRSQAENIYKTDLSGKDLS